MYKTRNTGTGNGIRGTRGMGGMLYSGECCQTFQGILLNIPGNVLKRSGERCQTFREMSPNTPRICSNIPGNVAKHSGECHKTFRGMSSNIQGNVIKHSGECRQTFQGMMPIFGVKEDNYWAGQHLESSKTSTMELFCENSQRP